MEDGGIRDQALVDCNISSLLSVTRAVLPSMVARRKGAVINISSFAARTCPLLSVYSATKAFVNKFSSNLEANLLNKSKLHVTQVPHLLLQVEYRASGITIMCAAPYYVVSKMSRTHQVTLTTVAFQSIPEHKSAKFTFYLFSVLLYSFLEVIILLNDYLWMR